MQRTRLWATVTALAASLPIQPAAAATITWDGAGPNANWSALDPKPGPGFGRTNWSGTNILPGVGDNLVFDGSKRLVNINDIAALNSIGSLSFAATAGAFTLGGGALTLTGGLSNLSKSRQTINMALDSGTAATVWDGGIGGVDIHGLFSLGNKTLSLTNGVSLFDTSGQIVVGANGSGALTLSAGSRIDTNRVVIAEQFNSAGRIAVDSGSVLDSPGALTVGSLGPGTLTIAGGGVVSTANLSAGGWSQAIGRISVSGAGSRLEGGTMLLGVGGSATLTLGAGGTIDSSSATLGDSASRIDASGAGATWTNDGLLSIQGGSRMVMGTGAAVRSGSVAVGTMGLGLSELQLSGAGTALQVDQGLSVGASGNGRMTVAGSAMVDSGWGAVAGPQSTVVVTGGGSVWNAGTSLQLGQASGGVARLQVQDGGTVAAGVVTIAPTGVLDLDGGTLQTASLAAQGSFNWLRGTLRLTTANGVVVGGPGSFWPGGLDMLGGMTLEVGNRLLVGTGSLRLAEGASASAATTAVGGAGMLELAGGTLQTGSLTIDGGFRWTAGTLRMTGTDGATLGTPHGPLARITTLPAGTWLDVSHDLRVGAGTLLVLDGGRASAANLLLDGGSVVGLQPLDLSDFRGVRGKGRIDAALHGGATTRIVAGGALAMGDLGAADGFNFDGRLEVGSSQVLLMAAALATPGSSVALGAGGQLVAPNGLLLGAGRRLEFAGAASVLGTFVNDGLVSGSDGRLTFYDDVSGSGGFAGDIVFTAGFSPGHSAARIDFGGGDAVFDARAVLTLELFGAVGGSGYDQLAGIELLDFNGQLQLVFGDGFQPVAGTRLALLDFGSFAGSLAADRIVVSGFDRRQLDFSQLASEGMLTVIAVPEPAGASLWLGGLALLIGWRRTRRVD